MARRTALANLLDVTPDLPPEPMLSRSQRNGIEIARRSKRRRRIDPCTTDREYKPDEWEFLQAMEAYKASSGRKFPTWCEALEVLKSLGYRKQ
jgi:hypothetical protein